MRAQTAPGPSPPASHRVSAAILVCASVICGCGQASVENPGDHPVGPVVDLPFAKSGRRLKAWSFAADGIDLFSTFHDNQLDADCEFVPNPARDHHVCFPSVLADVVYLDAACTQPAARSGPGGSLAPGQWVSGVVPGTEATCAGAPPVQRVGYHVAEQLFVGGIEALNHPFPNVFAVVDSQCQPTPFQDALLPRDLFRLERQEQSVFVSGARTVRPAAGDFAVERVMADDGAELTVGVRGGNAAPCLVQSDGRCVPGPVSAPSFFGAGDYLDTNCTEPAFSRAEANLCDDPKLGVKTIAGSVHVYQLQKASVVFAKTTVLDPETGVTVFDSEGRPQYSCLSDTGLVAYAAAAEVTSSFPLAGSTQATFGPLRLVQHGSPVNGGASASPRIAFEGGGVFIDEDGQGCKTRATAGRTLECDPSGPEVFESAFWEDAACEDRLYDFLGPHDAAAGVPDVSALRDVGQYHGVASTLLSFKLYAGPLYRFGVDGCSEVGSTSFLLEVDRAAALPELPLVER